MRFGDVQNTKKSSKRSSRELNREQIHNNFIRMIGHENKIKKFMFFGVKFTA